MYYVILSMEKGLSVRARRKQISQKAYEQWEVPTHNYRKCQIFLSMSSKNPYLLDILDLKENYLEADLEKVILTDIEAFILEFGQGFAFAERQKHMIIGGEDDKLVIEAAGSDLLFPNDKVIES